MTRDDTKKRGPEPERLALTGPWDEAVREALKSPPPPKKPTKRKGRGK